MADTRKPPAAPATSGGLSAADFIANPDKAIGELRAEIKREVIESNLMFAIGLYLLLRWERGGGRLF